MVFTLGSAATIFFILPTLKKYVLNNLRLEFWQIRDKLTQAAEKTKFNIIILTTTQEKVNESTCSYNSIVLQSILCDEIVAESTQQ